MRTRLRLLPGPTSALVLGLVIATIAIVCGIGSAIDNPGEAKAPVQPATGNPATPPPSAASKPEVVVHVVGEVSKPGLVHLHAGARVDDAIKQVGGAKPSANLAAINLAKPLTDGEQIVVPQVGQKPAESAAGAKSDCVDLNSATEKDLQELNGIGPALAGRIAAHREKEGPFKSVDELQDVSGIGPSLVKKIGSEVCV